MIKSWHFILITVEAMEVLSVMWFTYFKDHSDSYVKMSGRMETGRLNREAFVRIQAKR